MNQDLEKSRQLNRRLRWLSFALAVMVLVAIGTALFARRQQSIAESRVLAAESLLTLRGDQPAALALAVKAWRTAHTSEAHNAVTNSLAQVSSILGHNGPVASAVFSPDGQRIVTASSDQTARVWNAASGQLLATLQGHTNSVNSAVFSPDGQRIVTACADQTARVIRVVTLSEIADLLAK